ncbi:MAG: DNA translocase FtsK 4TM domain-containing protein [Pirellulales bacterium]
MAQPSPLRRDLCAIVLLAVVAFLTVALATYHPGDPVAATLGPLARFYHPDELEYPATGKVVNACGRWGAVAADLLLTAFGVGAYYLVLSGTLLSVALLRRCIPDMPALRFTGWLGSLIGVSTLAAIGLPEWSPGPMTGAGGYLGALGAGLLLHHFALLGSVILAGSFVIGGWLMCSDHLVPLILRWVCGGVLWSALLRNRGAAGGTPTSPPSSPTPNKSSPVKIAVGKTARKSPPPARVAEGEDRGDDGESDGEPTILPIRVRGKSAPPPSQDEPDDDDLSDDDSDRDASAEEEDDFAAAPQSTPPAAPARGGRRGGASRPAATATPTTATRTPAAGKAAQAAEAASGSSPHFKIKNSDPRAEVLAELQEGGLEGEVSDYELPSLDLLVRGEDVNWEAQEKEIRRKAKVLEKTFADFGFQVRVVEIETGPVIAQYEVELEAGLRLSKITSLADDLAIALRVPSVRIVAPIPGKNTVGIEVPNEERQVVRLREVIEETNGKIKKMRIPLFLGKDVSGNPLTVDLSSLPHLLIAGRTGTGKSVCLNAIITSILMTRRPDEVRMIMIDPKMVELSGYGRLPHLMHPVVTDMRKAEAILAWGVEKMEERYALLARAGVRHISSYNQLGAAELYERLQPEDDDAKAAIPKQLPFIVIVADEIADMMMTAGKEVEQHIIRLAQKSRAVGIHLILATQKPTVDVITGLIKSNLPARISFQVASRTDSRVVLDEMGADKLLGNGDMLFLWPGTSSLLRGQGTYLGDDEINRIVDCCSQGRPQNFATELVNIKVQDEEEGGLLEKLKKRDELYESAVDVVVREGRGSCSLLQRALGIGYGRAARLIDFMAEDGIVGTYAGSQAREVLLSVEDWERMQSGGDAETLAAPPPPPSAPAPRRAGRIVPEPSPTANSGGSTSTARGAAAGRGTTRNAAPVESIPWHTKDAPAAEEFGEEEVEGDDDEGSDNDAPVVVESRRSPPGRPSAGRAGEPVPRRGVISLVRVADFGHDDEDSDEGSDDEVDDDTDDVDQAVENELDREMDDNQAGDEADGTEELE